MSHYAAGANFERKVRDKLYADGAKLVVRSAGSKGPVDLVAFRAVTPIDGPNRRPFDFVQVKRNGRMTQSKREELCALAKWLGARPVLAYPDKVGRRVEVRLEVL